MMFPWSKKKKSASIAKERLMIAISSDRCDSEYPFLEDLKRDIIDLIKKYKKVSSIDIQPSPEDDNTIAIEVELENKEEAGK